MLDLPAVFTVLLIYITGVMIPGPNFVAVTHTAISSTRKNALALEFGIVLVNIAWATSAILGLGLLFRLFPWFALSIKIAGVMYLFWFGWDLIRKAKVTPSHSTSMTTVSMKASFLKGLAVNIANPKSVIFFGAVFSAAAPDNISILTLTAMLAVVGIVATLWYGFIALFLSSPPVANSFLNIKSLFDRCCGSAMILLGLKQAYEIVRR
ncbi:Threonine efflux protein [Thalassocella blandensis]|nr:Threonine efflux protein [Thalassocella blandensis]